MLEYQLYISPHEQMLKKKKKLKPYMSFSIDTEKAFEKIQEIFMIKLSVSQDQSGIYLT